jgi:hypothetical protein
MTLDVRRSELASAVIVPLDGAVMRTSRHQNSASNPQQGSSESIDSCTDAARAKGQWEAVAPGCTSPSIATS